MMESQFVTSPNRKRFNSNDSEPVSPDNSTTNVYLGQQQLFHRVAGHHSHHHQQNNNNNNNNNNNCRRGNAANSSRLLRSPFRSNNASSSSSSSSSRKHLTATAPFKKPYFILSCFMIALTLTWFLLARTLFIYHQTTISTPIREKDDNMIHHHNHQQLQKQQPQKQTLREVVKEKEQNHHLTQQMLEETQEKVYQQNNKRRQRTRPMDIVSPNHFKRHDFYHPDTSNDEGQIQHEPLSKSICGVHAQRVSSKDYFRKRDALNSHSHVLITGVLNPIGFHLVMALRERCGVDHIYGIDPMFPNTVIHRLHYLQPKLSLLTSHNPKWIWLPLPYVGLDAKRKIKPKPNEKFFPTTGELDWLQSYPKITHIVHLATSQPIEDHYHYNHGPTTSDTSDDDTSLLYSLRQSMTSMEQLLHSIAALKEDTDNTKDHHHNNQRPHFVYASSFLLSTVGADTLEDKNMFTAAKQMDELLAQTYYNIHNIYSVGLRFSHIYGPWGNPGTEYYDLAEIAVRHWHDEGTINAPRDFEDYSMLFNLASDANKKKSLVTEERDFLFVDDAVNAIIAAMQFRTKDSVPAIFNIASGKSVAMKYIADIMESMMPIPTSAKDKDLNDIGSSNDVPILDDSLEYLGWYSETSLQDGIRQLLAWHLDKHLPFGPSPYTNNDDTQQQQHQHHVIAARETSQTFAQRLDETPCDATDSTCLRYKSIFPCSSECSSQQVCSNSIFDSVQALSREVSEDCDVVLYTASLGRNVEDVKLRAELQPDEDIEEDPTVQTICNMAFVPKDSDLVQHAVEKVTPSAMERIDIQSNNNMTLEEKYDVLNGRLLHKGWILIWLPNATTNELTVEEMSLLKLSPSQMFHPTVKYAMFMDEDFSVSANLDDVQFMTSQMHRNALPERSTSLKVDGKKQKFYLPAEPERKCALLVSTLKLKKSDDKNEVSPPPGSKVTTTDAVKYMLYETGFDTSKSTPPAVKKQREFYQKIPTLVNKQDLRSVLEPKYVYHLNHWVRTRWVVHDLTIEEGRQLRCEWYKEHVQWKNDLDQFSFAHVMAQREIERRISRKEPDDHEKEALEEDENIKLLTDKHEWFLLWNDGEENNEFNNNAEIYRSIPDNNAREEDDEVNNSTEEQENNNSEEVLMTSPESGEKGVGIFARIISEPKMVTSRMAWTKEQEKISKKRRKKRQDKKKVHHVNSNEQE